MFQAPRWCMGLLAVSLTMGVGAQQAHADAKAALATAEKTNTTHVHAVDYLNAQADPES